MDSEALLNDNSAVDSQASQVVLVVEDDSAVRQPLVKFLQMRQYTVVTAETADEGLAAIREVQTRRRDHRSAPQTRLRTRRGDLDAAGDSGDHLLRPPLRIGRPRSHPPPHPPGGEAGTR